MPQLLIVFAAGAGIYAGLKWLSKALELQARAAADEAERIRRGAEKARGPKDLGVLELDPESGVYRPRAK